MSELGEEPLPAPEGEVPKKERRKKKPLLTQNGDALENGGLEREIFGKWTVFLRNIGGIIAVLTTCAAALLNAITTHLSVTTGGKWPSEITLLILNIGPIAIAVTYTNANKTIATIMGFATTASKIRQRAADIIAPKPQQDPTQSQ